MKINNELKLKNIVYTIENKKNSYFFIGILVGIIPFIILISILSTFNVSLTLKITIIICSLVISIINSFYLRNKSYRVMKQLFKDKYNIDYNDILKKASNL